MFGVEFLSQQYGYRQRRDVFALDEVKQICRITIAGPDMFIMPRDHDLGVVYSFVLYTCIFLLVEM